MSTKIKFDDLSERQQAYREVCERHYIEIGNTRTSAGEDAALYFTVIHDDKVCEPEQPVERFCAVTRSSESGDEIRYAYADFDTFEAAVARAAHDIGDDIYEEMPVEIVDLDTGRLYEPTIGVTWTSAT